MKWFRKWQEQRRIDKMRKALILGLKPHLEVETILVIDGVCEDCPGPDWCDCDQGIDCE